MKHFSLHVVLKCHQSRRSHEITTAVSSMLKLLTKMHWFDMPERVKFKLVSMVHNCLHHKAPWYLMDCCIPVSDVASRRHLRSATCHHLVVLQHSLSSYGHRAFAVTGPAAWNLLSDDLCDPMLSTDSFIQTSA